MICSFCSLLCDADDLGSIDCRLREKSLVQLSAIRSNREPILVAQAQTQESEQAIATSIRSLRSAKRILITGRIACVQTARAAIELASRYNATIDCSERGYVFRNVQAIQRNGMNSVSLAEARDHADLLIIIGDDSLLERCPRMPFALKNDSKATRTVLLLGQFGADSVLAWRSAGFDTWTVPCQLESVPAALAQWSRWREMSDHSPSTGKLEDALSNAQYTSVIWLAASLRVEQPDLWVERLLAWIAGQNELTRCAGLPWSTHDGTFQQVCTWLTGFPGRVRFQDGEPTYDTYTNSYERWIESSSDASDESVVVVIDETVPTSEFVSELATGRGAGVSMVELSAVSERFPTAVAGAEVVADMFRADQTLLARVHPTCDLNSMKTASAAEWLDRLSR
jgi:formylmethanofuran dehydrogenase subunit B